jgi:protein TonB
MLEGRLPAHSWGRLALSLGLSLLLHGIVLHSFGPADFSVQGPASEIESPGLTVSFAPTISPPQVLEVIPSLLVRAAAEPSPPPTTQAPATTVPGAVSPPGPQPAVPSTPYRAAMAGIVSGPWYYSARYLHRRPTPLKPIRPAYPPLVGDLAGNVVLLLLINERGTVDSHQIVKAAPGGIFEESVVTAFINERFAPGLITGYPVKSQLLVEVIFEPGAEPRTSVLVDLPR